MLTKTKLPRFSYAQRIIALPVMVLLVFIFSLKAQGISVKQVIKNNLPQLGFSNDKETLPTDTTLNFNNEQKPYTKQIHFNLNKK